MVTPTYTKPLVVDKDGHARELERQDIKNRTPLSASLEDEIIRGLHKLLPGADAVVVADQVVESDCGVITNRVRDEIMKLAMQHPQMVIAVDLRGRVGLFNQVILKPNAQEALAALDPMPNGSSLERLQTCAGQLFQRTQRPGILNDGRPGHSRGLECRL